jgi:transposase
MANRIQVSESITIIELFRKGWAKLRIARELDLDVKTVRRCIREAAEADSKSPLPHLREGEQADSKGIVLHSRDLLGETPFSSPGSDSKSLLLPAGKNGRSSQCEAYRERIKTGIESGLSAQRIYQDLAAEGFAGAYDSVKRFVKKLFPGTAKRVHRMECLPGEEAQVDFGLGAPIRMADGKLKRTWVFRIVLSYSRKAYSEVVLRQTTEDFIRCLENAFRHFGGVPTTLVIDNLRAAVSRADWYEPELNPKVREFSQHYGTVVLPTRPRCPEHKGKVESSVKYVKNNALKGRIFDSVVEENQYLLHWEDNIADRRIHGTTRQQVAKLFEVERSALHPLPAMLFPCFQEGRRRVHRDSFVEVEKAYYEVRAEEYIGRDVWVRWDGRMVRVFNDKMEQIEVHAKSEKGKFSYSENTTSRGRMCGVEHTAAWLIKRAIKIGPQCGAWADAVILNRGAEGIRPLYGFLNLPRQYTATALEKACERALSHGTYSLRDLRRLLEQPMQEDSTPLFMDSHPLIRDMAEYGAFLETLYPEKEPFAPKAAQYNKEVVKG